MIGETHPDTQQVFLNRAHECDILGDGLETTDCRIWFADQCGFMRRRRLKEAPLCQLQGCYQEKNQQTAFVALQVLRNHCNIKISTEALATGFAQVCTLTGLRGRWEILSESPLTICDTGHNSHGIRYVVEQLKTENGKRETENGKLHIVFGMVSDKDIDVVLNLLPEEAVYYFTQPATSRALPASQLLAQWLSLHPTHQTCHCFGSVATAISAAQKEASNEDIIFIGGSNYVVSEALCTK